MPKKVKNTAVKPGCFENVAVFDRDSNICQNCDVYIPCATGVGWGTSACFGLTRKQVEEAMASHNVAYADAVKAIVKLFPNVTANAAGLAYTRKVQKYRRKQYD